MVVLGGGAVSYGRGTPVAPKEEVMVEQDLRGLLEIKDTYHP